MRSFSTTRLVLGAALLLLLGLMVVWAPRPAPAQPMPAPARPVAAPSPRAAACHNGLSFDHFLADLKQQAVAAGVSQRALAEASPYLVYDQGIVNRDRGQRVFGQVFTEFAGRMAASYRMQQGQAHIKANAAAFARAEKEYGVPPPVIAAFWGLESDFGANMGNLPTLRSLVSLAYDCRRSEMFQNETIAALKIIDRGDLSPSTSGIRGLFFAWHILRFLASFWISSGSHALRGNPLFPTLCVDSGDAERGNEGLFWILLS